MVAVLAGLFASAALVTAVMARWNLRGWRDASSYVVVVGVMGVLTSALNALSALQTVLPYRTAALVIVSALAVLLPICCGTVLVMALTLASRTWHLTRRTALLLSIWPVVMFVAVVTNPWHHLVFKQVRQIGFGDMYLAHPQQDVGPIFMAGLVYVMVVVYSPAVRVIMIRRRATTATQRRAAAGVMMAYLPVCAVAVLVQVLAATVDRTFIDLMPLGQAATMIYVQARLIRTVPQQIPVPHSQVFAAITDSIVVVDREHRIIEANPAGDVLLHRINPSLPVDLTGYQTEQLGRLDLREDAPTDHLLIDVTGSGVDLHVLISPLFDHRHTCFGWAIVSRDITESNRRRHEAEEAATRLREQLATIEALQSDLAEQATRDALTGLYNRRYLMEQLPRLQRASTASLAIIDLDHFKQVNDAYGHAGGDAVLVKVGALLSATVRDGDVVARYGGEEFVVYLHGADLDAAWARLDALRELVKGTLIETNGQVLSATFSAGVAEFLPGRTSEDMLRLADEALYEAKRQGRDRVERAVSVGTMEEIHAM
jgi:diguanylate cyclase (GGDEF)-like protein